jgi:hypothetical protein
MTGTACVNRQLQVLVLVRQELPGTVQRILPSHDLYDQQHYDC